MTEPDFPLLILIAVTVTGWAMYLHERTGRPVWRWIGLAGVWLQMQVRLWRDRRAAKDAAEKRARK